MENLFVFLATSLVLRLSHPKFKRYFIGSGSSALLVAGNKTLHCKTTKDGDRISFYDQTVQGVTYGLVLVQMKEVYTLQQAENILVQYINRVRRPFGIAYNISMHIEKKNGIVTLTDYWQDEEGKDWKIKGYTNGKTVSLLYVRNISNAPVKEHDDFLNGFRFSRIS
ncbi:MAG TPA: hypothetical protein VMR70_14585 [Flavisolibacter sp.]|nr:hypothetical protein [Flavisolibacter sp.]